MSNATRIEIRYRPIRTEILPLPMRMDSIQSRVSFLLMNRRFAKEKENMYSNPTSLFHVHRQTSMPFVHKTAPVAQRFLSCTCSNPFNGRCQQTCPWSFQEALDKAQIRVQQEREAFLRAQQEKAEAAEKATVRAQQEKEATLRAEQKKAEAALKAQRNAFIASFPLAQCRHSADWVRIDPSSSTTPSKYTILGQNANLHPLILEWIDSQRLTQQCIDTALQTEARRIKDYLQGQRIIDNATEMLKADFRIPEELYGVLQQHIETMGEFEGTPSTQGFDSVSPLSCSSSSVPHSTSQSLGSPPSA